MKKTRFMRTFALVLALILALGTVVGVSAATEADNGAADVIAKNVAYESELSLVFAVDSANVQSGDTVYLLLWTWERAGGNYTLENAAQVKESFATSTVNGHEGALIFKSDRIAADNVQYKFYVRTCIVRGETKIYGEVFTYSVEDYAIQRLSENNVTPDQAALYYNVLRYAIAADAVLNETVHVENDYVFFVAKDMTFGTGGATLASIYNGTVPFAADCVVKNEAGVVVDITGELAPGFYTVSPAN